MSKKSAKSLILDLMLTMVFAAAHTQRPLYYSNQNHRFLYGLAHAGYGYWADDWLAGTADPNPLFSLLVEWTCRWGHPALFDVYYVAFMFIYVHSIMGIVSTLLSSNRRICPFLVFAGVFLFVHSRRLTEWLGRPYSGDFGNFLHTGVAGQYVLGPAFQPSVVGVLLIFSVYLFMSGRHFAALVSTSVAVTIHLTYALSAAFVTLAYLGLLYVSDGWRKAAFAAGVFVLTVAPAVAYNAAIFGPSSREAFTEANAIMAHERFPHHAVVEHWLNNVAIMQVAWTIAAIGLASGNPLGTILLVSFSASAGLTIVQVLLGSDALGLLFPWRSMAWLVPLATTVIFARMVALLFGRAPAQSGWLAKYVASGSMILVLVSAGFGVQRMYAWHAAKDTRGELIGFVRSTLRKGQVWLVPTNLQWFRLATGAPIVVDRKSHPYRDVEVLEWKRRMRLVDAYYGEFGPGRHARLVQLVADYGVTHVVSPAAVEDSELDLLYQDGFWYVYQVRTRVTAPRLQLHEGPHTLDLRARCGLFDPLVQQMMGNVQVVTGQVIASSLGSTRTETGFVRHIGAIVATDPQARGAIGTNPRGKSHGYMFSTPAQACSLLGGARRVSTSWLPIDCSGGSHNA